MVVMRSEDVIMVQCPITLTVFNPSLPSPIFRVFRESISFNTFDTLEGLVKESISHLLLLFIRAPAHY